jgi:sugar lactone lactonase YvrE
VLAFLLFSPINIEPVGWQPAPAPSLTSGPYAGNSLLKGIERIAPGGGKGPEAIAFDTQGRVYAGLEDGRIVRFDADGGGLAQIANTGGRPLGLSVHPDGGLIVCDAKKGLLKVAPDGQVTVLAASATGVPIGTANDLAVTADGSKVYFTDSSTKFRFSQANNDIAEHTGWGRFIVYDFASGKAQVLLRSLQFANGVALGPDEAYALIAETGAYRITRYWLKGEKAGTSDVFADNLPGFPDNITFNGKDRFWVALYAPRSGIVDFLGPYPFPRKMLARALRYLPEPVETRAFAVAFDTDGKLAANLQYDGADAYFPITSVREHPNGFLYFGSLKQDSPGRIKLPPAPSGAVR